ncbi:hypothetical protein BIW11_04378, partial [Tropilaelaps mercedesae]
ELIVLFLK